MKGIQILPFCKIFVSNDKLHKKTASLFLRDDQDFISGEELKQNLKALNNHFHQLPNEVRESNFAAFSQSLPESAGALILRLVEKHKKNNPIHVIKEFNEINSSSSVPTVIIKRKIKIKKGSWHQVSLDLREAHESFITVTNLYRVHIGENN